MQSKAYYAVIFSSKRTSDSRGYDTMAEKMLELSKNQKGFLAVESVRGPDGNGITISYWESMEDIAAWKKNSEHLKAQELGRNQWYESYTTRICKVEREYTMG